jgi:hypothetical protein
MAVFNDEINPADVANRGAGLLAPMYRHWLEFVIVIWIAMLETIVGPYYYFGRERARVIANWHVVRCLRFRLHAASGTIIAIGLLIATVFGKPIELRDAITAGMSVCFLSVAAWERWQGLHESELIHCQSSR